MGKVKLSDLTTSQLMQWHEYLSRRLFEDDDEFSDDELEKIEQKYEINELIAYRAMLDVKLYERLKEIDFESDFGPIEGIIGPIFNDPK